MSVDVLPQKAAEKDYTYGYYPEKGGYFIEDYIGNETAIRLPSYIDDQEHGLGPVVGISEYCFYQRRNLKTVVMSETITRVEEHAFSESGVKYLYLGPKFIYFHPTALSDTNLTYNEKDGVYYLPNESNPLFYAAGTKLTMFYPVPDPSCQAIGPSFFPEDKVSIPYGTFANCTDLEFVAIPGRISSIGQKAFPEGATFETYFEGNLEEWLRLSGKENFRGTVHLRFGENRTAVTSIELPDSIESLGSYAFSCCRDLTSIKGKGITVVGDHAFWNCSSLSSLELSPSFSRFGERVFEGCSAMSSFDVPEGTKEIGDGCFADCYSLSSITLPSSLQTIGNKAFAGCTGLAEINLPEGLKTLGEQAFLGCNKITSIKIPSSLTSMGNQAFKNCSKLSHVILSGSALGEGAFSGDDQLEEIYYQGDIKGFVEGSMRKKTLDYDIRFLDENGKEITKIVLPNGITEIKAESFAKCPSLTQITLPSTVKNVREGAFRDCPGLTKVSIPSSVTFIGKNVFFGSNNIQELSLPFFGGKASENNNITYLFGANFNGKLKKITLTGCKAVSGTSFRDNLLMEEVVLDSPIEEIEKGAFQGSSLTKITLPFSLETIGEAAFQRCDQLTSVSIPAWVTQIGKNAFKGCAQLSSVTIASKNLSIGSEAFRSCTKLKEIVFECSQAEFNAMDIAPYAIPDGVKKVFNG